MKVRKSILKRFKFTKSGKVLHLPIGQDHYRAKKSGDTIRKKRKWVELDKSIAKKLKKLLYYAPRKKKKEKKKKKKK